MGFMDKVKVQADALAQKTQQGIAQGQAKLDEMQAKRQADALLRDVGAAYYAERRHGGSHDAVEAALVRVDQHVAMNGAINLAPTAQSSGPHTGTAGPDQPGPGATGQDQPGPSPGG